MSISRLSKIVRLASMLSIRIFQPQTAKQSIQFWTPIWALICHEITAVLHNWDSAVFLQSWSVIFNCSTLLTFFNDYNILFLYHIILFLSHTLSSMDCQHWCCNIGFYLFIYPLYGILSPINSIFSNVPTLLCLCYGSFSN